MKIEHVVEIQEEIKDIEKIMYEHQIRYEFHYNFDFMYEHLARIKEIVEEYRKESINS